MTEIRKNRVLTGVLSLHLTRLGLFAGVGLAALSMGVPTAQAQTTEPTLKDLQDLPELPDRPRPFTLENQVQYFELWRDDKRPWPHTQDADNYWHRWLTQEFKVNPKLTWDQSLLEYLTSNQIPLAEVFEFMSEALVNGMTGNQGIYFKAPLSKVKEIHLTTTNYKRDTQDFGHNEGYFFSYNKATGVLTAAMTTTTNTFGNLPDGADRPLPSWIIKNVK